MVVRNYSVFFVRFFVILALLFSVFAAHGQTVSFQYFGTVQTITPGSVPPTTPQPWLTIGAPLTLTITFRTDVTPVDSNSDPTIGNFDLFDIDGPVLTYSLVVNGLYNIGTFSPIPGTARTENLPAGDLFSIMAEAQGDSGHWGIMFAFTDPSGRALSNDAWPGTLDSPFWQNLSISATFLENGENFTSSIAIPENHIGLMNILALSAFFGFAIWRQRREASERRS